MQGRVRTTHAGVLKSPQLIGGLRAGQHQRRDGARQTAATRDLQHQDEEGGRGVATQCSGTGAIRRLTRWYDIMAALVDR